MIKKLGLTTISLVCGISVVILLAIVLIPQSSRFVSPLVDNLTKQESNEPKPLEKYYFENLRERTIVGDKIILEKVIEEEKGFTSYLFSYFSDGKKVTGMANIPKGKKDKYPVIVMVRGYADDEIYFTGLGTRKGAAKFAEAGFITLAPDFLGFGESNQASSDVLEARFTRPITVLNLLASIESLSQADKYKIFLWGHSNGGQIALSVLEITQKNYPTTLWAPVTLGFPESILNYMDDYENLDEIGKEVYDRIKQFIQNYDPKRVSIDNYLQDINASIQIHQGGTDNLVEQSWSDSFVDRMKHLGKDISYYTYENSDHNLKQNWDEVVEKDIEFFESFLE